MYLCLIFGQNKIYLFLLRCLHDARRLHSTRVCCLLSSLHQFLQSFQPFFNSSLNMHWFCLFLRVLSICQKERVKVRSPSRGRLRVANHPIIWIKQVARHWKSSLKWHSILALGCLWKWKHISCLGCWDFYFFFSNKVRGGFSWCWIIGCLSPSQSRFTYLLFLSLNPRCTGHCDGIWCWALGPVSRAKHPICSGDVPLMQTLSFP